MRNLRKRYTYKQRKEFDATVQRLRIYIVPILLQRQHGVCNRCKKLADKYDVDHKVYNPMVSINELQLLCVPCHKAISDYRHINKRT